MSKSPQHLVEGAIARRSRRDQEIADRLAQAGFTDEDLYAALPNPGVDALLRQAPKKTKKGNEHQ